jgi:hypothetical protein
MAYRDNVNCTQMVFLGTVTLSGTTPAASAWVDTRGFDAASLIVKTNTVTDAGTAAGFSFEMQEGDDSTAAGATAVADAEIVGSESDLTVTLDTADDSLIGAIGYVGSKRYVRLNGTGTTGTNATVDVYAMLTEAHTEATTFVGTSVAAT